MRFRKSKEGTDLELLIKDLFALNFSLILLHEMDAIRQQEWKLFIFLKDMRDDVAYCVFTAMHMPLYFTIILLLVDSYGKYYTAISVGLDIFLIFHTVIHFFFRNKINNKFNNMFSNLIINTAGIVSLIHISIYFKLFVQ